MIKCSFLAKVGKQQNRMGRKGKPYFKNLGICLIGQEFDRSCEVKQRNDSPATQTVHGAVFGLNDFFLAQLGGPKNQPNFLKIANRYVFRKIFFPHIFKGTQLSRKK